MMKKLGMIISIDFELDWGYTDQDNPLSEDEVSTGLDSLIALLNKHKIKSTWAIVGQLFTNKRKEDNSKRRLHWITKNLKENDLIEIASHTYNHIFCEEMSKELIEEDFSLMKNITKNNTIDFKSIVFPRNQYSTANLNLIKKNSYTHYRSVLEKWYLKTNKYSEESKIKRNLIRIFEMLPFNRDAIIGSKNELISISDSRFFRFYPPSFLGKIISKIYLIVLKYELRQCIKRGNLYHIWFHPHNIIKKPNGLKELDLFLKYFKKLKVEKPQIRSYKFTEIG
jgi:peptidoglycan/xylan/chitin deacetylase (PgdA/CDA1 family)